MNARVALLLPVAWVLACTEHPYAASPPSPPLPPLVDFSPSFGESTPRAEGMDPRPLLALARRVRDEPRTPLFSLLVSRHGKLVFELYTSSLGREHAHYLMSVTKSVLSTLIGAALDRGLLRGPDESIAEALPRRLFAIRGRRHPGAE